MTVNKTPIEIAEEQATADRALLEKLQARQASLKEAGDPVADALDGIISQAQSYVLAAPNRAQRRHRAVDPKKMSSTVARARRKIRARIEKRSRARNRA